MSNAAGYVIYRADSFNGPFSSVGTSSTMSFTDTTEPAGRNYFYVVVATNGSSESLRSATVWANTFTATPSTSGSLSATSGNAWV